jgi:SAM-dependent methyltransferase
MTDTVGQRVQRYILDGSDDDLKRLVGAAELLAESTRTALRRSGIQAGWSVIECGCGPVGALTVMAELAGQAGRVVGVELNPAAVRRAQSVVDTLGLDNVQVIAGDVNELEMAAVGGPFDLAFTRLFLMHQPDPVRTLRQISGLLRPAGWIIAQETVLNPAPRSFPHLDALDAYWQLALKLVEGFGVPANTVERLPQSAAAAGLEVVRVDGSFAVTSPDRGFGIHAATLAAARDRATAAGLVAGEEIDALIAALRAAAADHRYEWVTSPFFLDLTLRKAG